MRYRKKKKKKKKKQGPGAKKKQKTKKKQLLNFHPLHELTIDRVRSFDNIT